MELLINISAGVNYVLETYTNYYMEKGDINSHMKPEFVFDCWVEF